MFPFAEQANNPGISRERKQMKAANALDRNDCTAADLFNGRPRSCVLVCEHSSVNVPQLETRAADRTGIRLGMKPPVQRVIIFPLAERAHRERLH